MESLLRICIKNSQPVELLDLTRALTALSDEYRRHIDDLGLSPVEEGQVKLFIKEIRSGSIEIDLLDMIPYAAPALVALGDNFNTVVDFARNLRACLDWFLRKEGDRPQATQERQRMKNMYSILEPVAKDRGSQMVVAPVINGKVGNLTINVLSLDSNAAQNEITRETELLREPVKGFHEKVLLRWYQTRNDTSTATGDKAIIEALAERPVKTVFLGESGKARMLNMEENFFRRAFLVDVQVDTICGKPALYKITAVHDTVDLPDGPENGP